MINFPFGSKDEGSTARGLERKEEGSELREIVEGVRRVNGAVFADSRLEWKRRGRREGFGVQLRLLVSRSSICHCPLGA